jgi:Ca2+-binding EF-hand superfamily protein
LAQKSSGVQSEEAILMKSFKYFDLNNNGTVEPEEFAKAIEKIGIMIPTQQVRLEGPFTRLLPSLSSS